MEVSDQIHDPAALTQGKEFQHLRDSCTDRPFGLSACAGNEENFPAHDGN
jgi:hypothetical protein